MDTGINTPEQTQRTISNLIDIGVGVPTIDQLRSKGIRISKSGYRVLVIECITSNAVAKAISSEMESRLNYNVSDHYNETQLEL